MGLCSQCCASARLSPGTLQRRWEPSSLPERLGRAPLGGGEGRGRGPGVPRGFTLPEPLKPFLPPILLNQSPSKPTFPFEFMINVSIPNFIPFLFPSEFSPVLTEHSSARVRCLKIAAVENIVNVLRLLL